MSATFFCLEQGWYLEKAEKKFPRSIHAKHNNSVEKQSSSFSLRQVSCVKGVADLQEQCKLWYCQLFGIDSDTGAIKGL